MARAVTLKNERPKELALHLVETLHRERCVPRFVDSYVLENERYGLQVHATFYRELLDTIGREALLAMTVRALADAPGFLLSDKKKAAPREVNRAVRTFRQAFLAALTRIKKWSAGDALDFQADLALYERLVARAAQPKRRRKPFELAEGPFVDRCAILLDPSMLENARLAAAKLLAELERLTESLLEKTFHAARMN